MHAPLVPTIGENRSPQITKLKRGSTALGLIAEAALKINCITQEELDGFINPLLHLIEKCALNPVNEWVNGFRKELDVQEEAPQVPTDEPDLSDIWNEMRSHDPGLVVVLKNGLREDAEITAHAIAHAWRSMMHVITTYEAALKTREKESIDATRTALIAHLNDFTGTWGELCVLLANFEETKSLKGHVGYDSETNSFPEAISTDERWLHIECTNCTVDILCGPDYIQPYITEERRRIQAITTFPVLWQ